MKQITFYALAALSWVLPSTILSAQSEWTDGHGDIGVGYEDEGSGFELHPHWHIEGGTVDGTPRPDQEFEAADLTLVVPDNTDTQSVRPAGSDWDPIGVAAGEGYWTIPNTSTVGVPFMGWATEELTPANWDTPITFALTGLTGPGDISLYSISTTPNFHWASSNGITGADSFDLSIGAHTHHNMTFTEAGLYSVEITFSGTHTSDGFQTATETFSFNVVPEPSTALLLGAGMAGLLLGRRGRRPGFNSRGSHGAD